MPDIFKNPYTTRFNFFMKCLDTNNMDEVSKVYHLLLNGVDETEVAKISPLFKDFLGN